ncbi:hypothetical protein Tco_0286210 [Tanacetum coccineum]
MHQSEEPKALYGVTSLKDYAVTYSNKEMSHHTLYGIKCLQDYAATFKYTRDDVSDSALRRNIYDRGNVGSQRKCNHNIGNEMVREDAIFENKNNDAHEHVEQVLDIVSLFNIPGVSHDAVMQRIFLITLTGAAKRWVDRLPPRTISSWDLLKKDFIQSISIKGSSSEGIVAIVNKLENLGRDIKKLKENVYAIQVGCQNCGGAHLDKDCPLKEDVKSIEEAKYGEFGRPSPFSNGAKYRVGPPGYYTQIDNRPPVGENRPSLEELMNKHLEEST